MPSIELPSLGFGLGLRPSHYDFIKNSQPKVDWFEIISENYMDTEGRPKRHLAEIKERYPIVMHGVSLSIGTVDPLNSDYLRQLKKLMDWVNPAWISDHLCWTGVAHRNVHDLLPVPYTEGSLKHIVDRIKQVQDFLERPIALENPSTYLEFNSSSMSEAEFMSRMVAESGCWLLLDVNNVYVSCYNHRLDPKAYLDAMPLDKVVQIHLAGHENHNTHLIDTHNGPVIDDVWQLYRYVVKQCQHLPNTMIEWDDAIPEFPVLYAELEKAKCIVTEPIDEPLHLPKLYDFYSEPISTTQKSLVEEQHWLQQAILLENTDSQVLNERIKPKVNFSPEAQLGVYINAYKYRLFDVVYEDYPALKHYLGDEAYEVLLWQYIQSCRSDHYNIARFSLGLPDFVSKTMPKDRFAFELSILEATILRVFDAPESPVLSADCLTHLTEASLMNSILVFRTALSCLSLSHAVNAYYQCVMDETVFEPPCEPMINYLVVFRSEDTIWRLEMETLEFALFERLLQGQVLGEALTVVLSDDSEDDQENRVSLWFARWMHHRLLSEMIAQ